MGLIAAFAALAGRLLLIQRFGTVLPYQDQWRITAVDVLKPWAEGNLTVASFFQPMNSHWNVLSRFYSYVLTLANGQWNNLMEIVLNALLYSGVIFLFVSLLTPALQRGSAIAVSLFAGVALGMPLTWENTLMGVQVDIVLQIGLSLFYLWAMTCRSAWSRLWWLAQLSAGLVLFTQRSGVLAIVPVLLLQAWCLVRNDGSRRERLAGLGSAAFWIAAYFVVTPPFVETAEMKASSWRIWLDVTFRQLAWPLPHPGWAFFTQLPGLCFIVDRLGRRRLASGDAFLIATVLWVGAQAAAIGYGRGEVTTGFVSRYCDFLAWGLIAQTVCLVSLLQRSAQPLSRAALGAVALAWTTASLWGIWNESVTGHTRYNLDRRSAINAANIGAIHDYLATGNPQSLAAVNPSLYSYPPAIAELLSVSRLRSLLPPETGASEARHDHGRIGTIMERALPFAPWVAFGAAGASLAWALWRRSDPVTDLMPLSATLWTPHRWKFAAITASVAVWLALLAWWKPFSLGMEERWRSTFPSNGAGNDFPPTVFESTVGRAVRAHEMDGAVATLPVPARRSMQGTLLDGLDYTGIVRSAPVKIHRKYLYALITGWPNSPGNAIRWELSDPVTGRQLWLPVLGSPDEPGDQLMLWSENVTQYQGWNARLYLFDGTTDNRGWVGISQPVMSDDSDFGRKWVALQHSERAEPMHRVLIVAAMASLCGWLAAALAWLWSRGRNVSHSRRLVLRHHTPL